MKVTTEKPSLVKYIIDDEEFLIPPQYEVKKILGSGAYGVVVSAYDKKNEKYVAIKKNLNVFELDPELQKRILRELKIMEHFDHHENVISLVDLIPPKDFDSFKDVYIVMDLMDGDFKSIIRGKNPQPLDDGGVKYFLYQLLRGVKYVHSANVLHRDIKPSNILLNKEMDVKICDFGLSRGVDMDDPTMSTQYVATRWYRAPELIMMWEKCSKEIDVWSIGCVFFELLQDIPRRPVFPGKNYLNQLDLILEFTGTPKEEDILACDKAKFYLKKLPLKLKKQITSHPSIPKNANPIALDLLEKMLQWNPKKRITIEEAMKHEYFQDLYDESDLEECKTKFEFDITEEMLKEKDKVKQMIYDDIMAWNLKNHNISGDAIVAEQEIKIEKI
eukprot:gene4704-8288_t